MTVLAEWIQKPNAIILSATLKRSTFKIFENNLIIQQENEPKHTQQMTFSGGKKTEGFGLAKSKTRLAWL